VDYEDELICLVIVLVAYSHNRDPVKGPEQKSGIVIVTALVDSISKWQGVRLCLFSFR